MNKDTDAPKNIKRIIQHGRVLGFPTTQPEGTKNSVGYELGKAFQLDRTHIFLVASLDEQGGGDLCVGNDGFVIQKLADIAPEKAIPINRPDPAYRLKSGEIGFLAKFPVSGGFVPLGAKLEDGRPHPAAGTGFLVSACYAFPADRKRHIEDPEPSLEFIQLRWDGKSLQITGRQLKKKLFGLELNGGIPISYFLPKEGGFLVPLGVKEKGDLVFRFDWDGEAWMPVGHGEPFLVNPEGETEPSIQKENGRYLIHTRGTDPYGRLYASEDGLNYKFLSDHPNHTVPQVLNQGLDGSLYLTTNPGPGWIRNPLLAYPLAGDSFGAPFVLHDEEGIRGDSGSKIPFIDHAVGVNLFMENRWRHLIFYRVCDLKERTLHSFQAESDRDVHGDIGPVSRRKTDGLYLIEIEYKKTKNPPCCPVI